MTDQQNPSASPEAGRHLSDTKPQPDVVEKLAKLGREEREVKFGDTVFGIRSMSPADEIYVYDRSAAEASTPVARLLLARVYIACLMIKTIDGTPVEDIFKTPAVEHRTDRDRTLVCNFLSPVFGQQWDRRAFRLFFRLIWAWSETCHLHLVADHGVEAFLTPEELQLYRQVKDSEAVATALNAAEIVEIEDSLGGEETDSGPDALEVGDVE